MSSEPQARNEDGSYSPMTPLGWQGSGIDWEVHRESKGWRAEGYDEDVLCHVVRSRSKVLLGIKMNRAMQ